MAIRPRMFVDPPRYQPLGFGLLSVVQWVDETDKHWMNGIEFQPDSFADAHLTAEKCFDGDGEVAAKTPTDGIDTRCANPVTVYSELECSALGHWDDYKARTVTALDNGQGRPLETAFWTGVTGEEPLFPHLAADELAECQTAAVVVSGAGAPVPWQIGIARLEAALADCYGGVGVLHMPYWVAAILVSEMYLIPDKDKLRTRLGNLVAAGTGYPGTGPDGSTSPANGSWVYATGAMTGRQSVVDIGRREESLDRTNNSMVMVAERTFVFAWDGCHLAAQINLAKEVA